MTAMCLYIKQSPEQKRGAVLLIVLGVILLASWMLVQILASVGDEISLRGQEDQNDALQASAFQSLEVTIGVLAEIKLLDGDLYSPVQGWGNPLAYAGFPSVAASNEIVVVDEPETISGMDEMVSFEFPYGINASVVLRDESGRLPLNHTSEERWKLLFEEMEIQSGDIDVLVDSLLDWIDADSEPRLNGAETGVYQRREPAYLPANAPIEDLHELQLVEGFDRLFFDEFGMPNDLFRTFSECVSIFDCNGVNLNTAHPLVLEVMGEELEFEPERITDYLSGIDLEPGTEDDNVLRPGLDDPDLPTDDNGDPIDFSATCRILTAYITTESAGTVFNLSARLDTGVPSEGGIYPVTILDLQMRGSTL